MAPRKKPDATDTEPPKEERPDTTATPLLASYSPKTEKLLSPAVKFKAVTLCRWLEYLAEKHMMTKCLSATVRERLMFELSAIAREIARKHLGGT